MSLKESPFYEQIKERVETLLLTVRTLYQDGNLSVSDWSVLIREVINTAYLIVQDVSDAEEDRRALFMQICVATWDDLGRPYNIPVIPDVLEDTIVDPVIAQIVEFAAGVAYDFVVRLGGRKGVVGIWDGR